MVGKQATSWIGATAVLGLVCVAGPALAADPSPPAWALAAEAPELARPGERRVGTVETTIPLAARPGLTGAVSASLGVRLYYPAAAAGGTPAVYTHTIKLPKVAPYAIEEHGLAFEDAPPASGDTFPLVVVSHGYGGWSAHFSRLLELVASRGYVVAALDHDDGSFENVPEFLMAFGNVLVRRPADQRGAIAAFTAKTTRPPSDPLGLVDPAAPIGLLGYSMGGYGALNTAGATYSSSATPYAAMPQPLKDALATPSRVKPRIGALVAVAPWGAQPESRVFDPAALTGVTAPTLLIDGSHDDIVNYRHGVRWLFDGLKASDRYLLTLREARHNVLGNAIGNRVGVPPEITGFFADPVWRQERINQVTAHFVVAFLDRTLKRDLSKAPYLDVPVEDSSAGKWPIQFGEQTGGTPAGQGQPGYWRGFARGWATGMTLEHRKAGQ